ncbi:MAG TPA: type II toxin-antitoxin system VapC family toxin [Terriglobia bacterium]|nr:type II toxin-antitoxin system VapC family toxin [Terriglobia bacterium]
MRYLLDTDICIYITKQRPAGPRARLERLRPGDVAMSVITYSELLYGAWKSQSVEANLAIIDRLRSLIPVLPADSDMAEHYGRLRAALEKKGRPIGAYDMLIAAHALSRRLILVTNNAGEFSRVEGLRLENWVD